MGARSNEWSRGGGSGGASSGARGRGVDWPFISSRDVQTPGHADRRAVAQRIQNFCQLRQESFGAIIHDAPFNLLIDMYVNECRNRRVTVGDACLAARAPQTTALRAIQTLVEGGCVERSDDATDNRRKLLSLTAKGRDKVARFIDRFAALEGS